MATLFQFASQLVSLPSFISQNNPKRRTIVCLASTNKPRPSRKLMSDEQLCSVLREFVVTVGLSEGHVPSTKDLTNYGRKDLANIVRRRGHKFIKTLLSNSSETDADESETVPDESETVSDGSETVTDGCETVTDVSETVAGGSETVTDESETVSGGSETITDGFDSQKSIDDNSERIHTHEETGQEQKVYDLIEESTDIPLIDNSYSTGNSSVNDESDVNFYSQSQIFMESQASLQEKVDKFMKYGQLDIMEDNKHGDSTVNIVKEVKSSSSGDDLVESEPVMKNEVDISHTNLSDTTGLNGALTVQNLSTPTQVEDKVTRDSNVSAQRQTYAGFGSDVNLESSKLETVVEINHLIHMLHQKELELSQLKDEIEKEKHALAILQSVAESEINKAQKLITEKDAELNAAEESLSGLVEAKIQYSGEGQMVEVAGSFNGWHQRIMMEPQPSSVLMDPSGTRKFMLWSITLWLYPGVYEIKFIVDGQWKVDPQRESIFKGGMENNLLRVR